MTRERGDLIDVALGRKGADLVLHGSALLNVSTGEILESCDIAIRRSRIASVGVPNPKTHENSLVLDAEGFYAIPGLIDGHIHIESSMLRPTEFCRVVLPSGTTSVMIDPHEIANVLGLEGVSYMLSESKDLPLKFFVQIPSCVPAAPSLETSGAELDEKDISTALEWPRVIGLAEVMNYPGVLAKDSKMLAEIETTLQRRKIVEGHAPSLTLRELNAYASVGIKGDHESVSSEDAIMKLRLGMTLEIRGMKNLGPIISSILDLDLDTHHCILVTDDKHADDLLHEGHMNHLVRRVVEEGVDPIKAIQMATINVAEHFHLESEIGSISPGRLADIALVQNLGDPNPSYVFANGILVAKDGKLTCRIPSSRCPKTVRKSFHLKEPILPTDLRILAPADSSEVDVLVIGVIDGEVCTERLTRKMKVHDGLLVPDLEMDILKVAVVERHKATGNIGLGLVSGFGIKRGAIASSVGHDSHNIVAVGASDSDMASAVSSIAEMDGGIVVVENGRTIAAVPLSIAGLMSEKGAEEVVFELKEIQVEARRIGATLSAPFISLSFLPLAVIPRIRITDKGLVDVEQFEIVSLLL